MCSYKTLKNNQHGYVIQCNECDQIQVAFSTVILSLSTSEFYELIKTASELHDHYQMHPCRDQKIIQLPTATRSVTMVFNYDELKTLLHLMMEGRNKLQFRQLFVFNEN